MNFVHLYARVLKLLGDEARLGWMLAFANISLAAAQFAEPDRLLPARTDNRHLAFGYGAHFCVGAALARLEGAVAIGALLARFPRIGLASNAVRWRPNTTMRGLEALPVGVR